MRKLYELLLEPFTLDNTTATTYRIVLVPSVQPSASSLTSLVEEFTLGREQLIYGATATMTALAKKVSRESCVIHFNATQGTAQIKRLAKNVSYLLPVSKQQVNNDDKANNNKQPAAKNNNSSTASLKHVIIPQDCFTPISHNDIFSLVSDKFWFRVQIKKLTRAAADSASQSSQHQHQSPSPVNLLSKKRPVVIEQQQQQQQTKAPISDATPISSSSSSETPAAKRQKMAPEQESSSITLSPALVSKRLAPATNNGLESSQPTTPVTTITPTPSATPASVARVRSRHQNKNRDLHALIPTLNDDNDNENDNEDDENNNVQAIKSSATAMIAMPLLATGTCQFNINKAVEIAVSRINNLFTTLPSSLSNKVEIHFFIPNEFTEHHALLKREFAKLSNSSDSIIIHYLESGTTLEGAIMQHFILQLSQQQIQNYFICNECNWRFKPLTAFLNKLDSTSLEAARQRYTKGEVGSSYMVPAQQGSELVTKVVAANNSNCKVHILHVIVPNMNDTKPDSLKGDYEKGSELLSMAYDSLLENFVKQAFPDIKLPSGSKAPAVIQQQQQPEIKSKQPMNSSAASSSAVATSTNKNSNGDEFYQRIKAKLPAKYNPPVPGFGVVQHNWQNGLLDVIKTESNVHTQRKIYYNHSDVVFVIYDAFPKSTYHMLIIPKRDMIPSVNELQSKHLPLLEEMLNVGNAIIKQYVAKR